MKAKIKILLASMSITFFFSCKEEPTYNPFDNQFNVSVRSLIRDNCDTISAECGYYNLTKREGKLRPYYQIYDEEFHEVIAKGFIYTIDTFEINGDTSIYDRAQMDSILKLPLNEIELNEEFGKFDYKISSRYKDSIQIVNTVTKDTVGLELRSFPIYHDRFFLVRGIGYYKTEEKSE